MVIAFSDIEEWERPKLTEALKGHTLKFMAEALTTENAAQFADAEIISPFVRSKLTAEVIAKLPKLKHIATRSTGFDHIDLASCKKRGISVSNVPSYGENTVAEHAFALLLALSHRIPEAIDYTKRGGFIPTTFRGFDLKGRTLGVIGAGRIGQHSIKIGNGFGMNVIAFDAFPKPELEATLNFKYVALEELLRESDVVTLHTVYTKETHHLINQSNITLMKRGAVLINTARGGLVETGALLKGLREGILAGVGLDVVEEESGMIDEEMAVLNTKADVEKLRIAIANHALLEKPNVIITPHSAFNTSEAIERILATTTENITAFAAGTPHNIVPLP